MQFRPRIVIFCLLLGCLLGLLNYRSLTIVGFRRSMNTASESNKAIRVISDCAPTPIVILTYPRSGSTFLGDSLRHSDGMLYVFEPLHFVRKQWDIAREKIYAWDTTGTDNNSSIDQDDNMNAPLSNISLHFINGSESHSVPYLDLAEHVIRSILTCRFVDLPLEYWTGAFKKLMSYQMLDFYEANRLKRSRRYFEPDKFKDAVETLDADCTRAKAILIKTIRIPLFILNNLLKELKSLKILHLIRDPRPTMMSQHRTIKRIQSLTSYAGYFCTRVLYDITTFNIFNNSKQILRIRYENLASSPVYVIKHIYRFLNLTYTSRVENIILTLTSTGETVEEESKFNNLGL